MDDLISRQAMMKEFSDFVRKSNNSDFANTPTWNDAVSLVGSMQSVQPEPQWIPVSERLPSDGTWNIFTDGKNISVERYKADAIDHFFPNGRWFQLEDVIAWMPLPKPFEGGAE